MSFDWSALPFYAPNPSPLRPHPSSLTFLESRIGETEHHVRQVSLALREWAPDLVVASQALGIGRIHITHDSDSIGHLCITPEGHLHFSFLPDQWTPALEQTLLATIPLSSISIRYPSRATWALSEAMGYSLRSELVRWFARVGPKENPYQYFLPERARKMRTNARKAARNFSVTISPLTQENFSLFYTVYKEEIVTRPHGTTIFYNRLFEQGLKMEGLLHVQARSLETGEYVGGCLVTPWGREPLNPQSQVAFTTFLMSAFKKEARQFALGYLLDDAVMGIARERGEHVYGHGGDPNFWGHEIKPGLFTRKVACNMFPVPAMSMEAFKLTALGHQALMEQESFFLSITDSDFLESYFSQQERHPRAPVDDLWPRPWESPNALERVTGLYSLQRDRKGALAEQMPPGLHV